MRRDELLGGVGLGLLPLACCGLLPVVVAFLGAGGLAALFGAGAVVIAAAGVGAALLLAARGRRRPGSKG
jgi:hypothetical protein